MDAARARVSAAEEAFEGEKVMPVENGSPRQSSGQAGPHGQGPGSGHGGGQRLAQGADYPDWLVNTVGTLVIGLGAIVFRALARKLKASPGKDAGTDDEQKTAN